MAVPSKLTSYFISGKPIVAATDPCSGTAHEIKLSGGGHLVPAGDPEALLTAVGEVGQDRETALKLGASGRAYALSTLSSSAAIERYESWCRSLATH